MSTGFKAPLAHMAIPGSQYSYLGLCMLERFVFQKVINRGIFKLQSRTNLDYSWLQLTNALIPSISIHPALSDGATRDPGNENRF